MWWPNSMQLQKLHAIWCNITCCLHPAWQHMLLGAKLRYYLLKIKQRCPIWLMKLPLFATLETKPSKRCHVGNIFISDRLNNLEIVGDYLLWYSWYFRQNVSLVQTSFSLGFQGTRVETLSTLCRLHVHSQQLTTSILLVEECHKMESCYTATR